MIEPVKQYINEHSDSISQHIDAILSDRRKLFLVTVVVPFVFTAIYLYIFSPDRYISQSKLSVYDADIAPISNDLFSTLGLNSGQEQNDMRLLQAYLYSPELLKDIDAELNAKTHYASSWDFLFGIGQSSSAEDFLDYFHQRMNAQIDSTTGLLTLTTEGFDPGFSLSLNQLLLKKGEQFINDLSQNIARKEMQFAQGEMSRSLTALSEAQSRLADFQAQTNLANPLAEGESIITIAYQLEASLAEAEAQLKETLTYLSEESPQAKALTSRIAALKEQVQKTKSKFTGSESDGINQVSTQYHELLLEVQLARTVHETSLSSFELARTQSTKQLKHFLVASSPTLAEDALLPKRGYWLSTLTLLYLCIYGIFILIARSVAEHRE